MRQGQVVSKVTYRNGLTKILVKGIGKERNERRWVCSPYGHLVQTGARISWRLPGMISAKSPWGGGTIMVRRIGQV